MNDDLGGNVDDSSSIAHTGDGGGHDVAPPPRVPLPLPPPTDPAPSHAGTDPPPWGRTPPWPPPVPSGVAPPPQPLRPGAWGWKMTLAGAFVALTPQALMAAAALRVDPGDAQIEVTLLTGTVVLIVSLLLYGWQVGAAWMFSLRITGGGLRGWGLRTPTTAFFWTIPLALATCYAVALVNDAVLHPPQQDILTSFPRSGAGIALLVVVAVVMAPLFEEAVFRGFLFGGLADSWGWWRAAAASGLVFAVAHAQLTLVVPLFALGFALAWVYHRTGSLWTSIAMHAVFNGLAVLVWALTG